MTKKEGGDDRTRGCGAIVRAARQAHHRSRVDTLLRIVSARSTHAPVLVSRSLRPALRPRCVVCLTSPHLLLPHAPAPFLGACPVRAHSAVGLCLLTLSVCFSLARSLSISLSFSRARALSLSLSFFLSLSRSRARFQSFSLSISLSLPPRSPARATTVLRAAPEPPQSLAAGPPTITPNTTKEFKAVLKALERDAAKIVRDANETVFARVVEFVHTHAKANDRGSGIPTCVVLAGTNVADNHGTLRNLSKNLSQRCKPCCLATISPRHEQTIAGMLGSILQQLTTRHTSEGGGGGEGGGGPGGGTCAVSAVSHQGSMQNIRQWYSSTFPAEGGKGGEGGKEGRRAVPLLIMLEEMESIDPDLFSDLVGVLYEERGSLPLALVLNLSGIIVGFFYLYSRSLLRYMYAVTEVQVCK